MGERTRSIVIEAVSPQVDAGRHAAKRLMGTSARVEADIFKEGHDLLTAVVRFRQAAPRMTEWAELPLEEVGNDRWAGSFPLEENGRYLYTVEAWPDSYRTWVLEVERKLAAGREVLSELCEGAALLKGAAERAARQRPDDAKRLADDAKRLADDAKRLADDAKRVGGDSKAVFARAAEPCLVALASRYADRAAATRFDRELEIFADRPRAEVGAWYELFPRSAAGGKWHGTFKDVEGLLAYVEELGFDVLYLPPIHPIGHTARKGKNNALSAQEGDVGSPWAIGAREGGHRAVHPALGTLEDFRRLVGRAAEHGIEVALDLAFQCSPDHPYLKDHPEWFQRRPDGSIKTAENPPKRYEDIVNFDWMGPARESLWGELKSVVLHWVENGVRLFRVDNPHTKPLPFWGWLIREVQTHHPDVVFLAEAFTRPKLMRALAKVGFSQSYTYFTWRNFKGELTDYLTELTQSPVAEYMRGNLWPNTPDILPEFLQRGGPAAFRIRAALAATLSSSWGIYQGYELCESRAHQGEEYLDSEKYQLGAWDLDRPGNIKAFLSSLNRIRRENPALWGYRNLRFEQTDNGQVLFYGKSTQDGQNQVLVVVSLDPLHPQRAVLQLPALALGVRGAEAYELEELITKSPSLVTGDALEVSLTPEAPAAIYRVRRTRITEKSFDYY